MTNSSAAFRVGTRTSRLALIQTHQVVATLQRGLPTATFEVVAHSSPGDRDQKTDLRASPGDFFTRDLDQAVRNGVLDCAIHSAKDMPEPMPDDLDWCWLGDPAEPEDAMVMRPGQTQRDCRPGCRIGVSSDRRRDYARRRFPDARLVPIRGNIDVRLEKLDSGEVDMVLMAGCALVRLGLEQRITAWIPLADLPTPEGQGRLGMTFRHNDERLLALRAMFTKAVTFAGAGAGSRDQVTLAVKDALAACDVCLHDALMDARLLEWVHPRARIIDVGKRAGHHRTPQEDTTALITKLARQGGRVVRLKGGDPGIFGRLAEETAALDQHRLPYRVLPGISSLQTATTATGMLLTKRGVSNGFAVMTARRKGGGITPVDAQSRARFPIAFFMGVKVVRDIAAALVADGWPADSPAAVVFDAGGTAEHTAAGTLTTIGDLTEKQDDGTPGLFLVGSAAAARFPAWGPLGTWRVMLTCSDALQTRAAQAVLDYGGRPLHLPLVRLQLAPRASDAVRDMDSFDWLVITSPSAARLFGTLLRRGALDARHVPRLLVAGRRTAEACLELGLTADIVPDNKAGTDAVINAARGHIPPGSRVLRLRSDRAGSGLGDALRHAGTEVEDRVLYANVPVTYDNLPARDAVVFASTSAVDAFVNQFGVDPLAGSAVVAIGNPTATALEKAGRAADIVPDRMTVEGAVESLARVALRKKMETHR